MDEQTFDQTARRVAAPTDRRSGLKAALAALAAAPAAVLLADAAAKGDGKGKGTDAGKGKGRDRGTRRRTGHGGNGTTGADTTLNPAATACKPRGTACRTPSECCAGLGCEGGTCAIPTATLGPTGARGATGAGRARRHRAGADRSGRQRTAGADRRPGPDRAGNHHDIGRPRQSGHAAGRRRELFRQLRDRDLSGRQDPGRRHLRCPLHRRRRPAAGDRLRHGGRHRDPDVLGERLQREHSGQRRHHGDRVVQRVAAPPGPSD